MGRFSRLGNDLYNGDKSIDFVGRWKTWYAVSAVLVLIALFGLTYKGLNFGIEFVGGTEYQVSVSQGDATQDLADELREAVGGLGIEDAAQPVVTTSGDQSILVQTETLTTAEDKRVMATLAESAGVSLGDISKDEVGESWGRDIVQRALIGLAVFLVVVVLFIWTYFREWKMSVGALVALGHDVLITVGIYALSGFEVSPATVTGLLTILGFSLYDTVVVFDKVKENTLGKRAGRRTYAQAANLAVNQTLVRSINTSIVALLPVGALLYVGVFQLGTGSLKDLALALFVGMAVGLYSSVFIATPLVVQLKAKEQDVVDADRRALLAQKRKAVDPYASVPNFTDNMPLYDEQTGRATQERTVTQAPEGTGSAAVAPPRQDEALGLGRVVPEATRPVQDSGSAKRAQPTRTTRSKRGKK